MIGLETDRLRFRQWKDSDLDQVADFFAVESNARYVGGVMSREQSWRKIATYIGHYELLGYSYPAIEEKATGNLIGSLGLWNSPEWPELEMGYWLFTEAQGKGYGTEAGQSVKTHALVTLKMESLVSFIDPANESSKKLAMRLGGKYDKTIELLDFGPHEVYRYK